jgi:hypothetical protein
MQRQLDLLLRLRADADCHYKRFEKCASKGELNFSLFHSSIFNLQRLNNGNASDFEGRD